MKALTVAFYISLIASTLAVDCSTTFTPSKQSRNKYTVTYDLSPLVHSEQWEVRDSDLVSRNYSYVFNICTPVRRIPSYGTSGSQCANKTDAALYPAYQLDGNGGGCYHLGKGTESRYMRWRPIDDDDPTTGVILSYIEGDSRFCSSSRSLHLSFFCMNNFNNLPKDSAVIEYPMCAYNMQLESIYGCPVECGQVNNKLCGGRGVCGFDRDISAPRCFCNEGYYGSACEKEGSDLNVLNSTSSILLVVAGFLVLVEIGVIIMWQKVKGLRLDPSAYANLNKESMGMYQI